LASYFGLDTITDIALGCSFGCLENGEDMYGFMEQFDVMLPAMIILTVFPGLGALLRSKIVKNYILPSDKDPSGFGKVIGFVNGFSFYHLIKKSSLLIR